MEITESVKVIEKMMAEGRKSINNYSPYFILWGAVMFTAAITEYFLVGQTDMPWIVWPIAGGAGGILSAIIGSKQKSNSALDRIVGYTWLTFGICLLFSIFYSLHIQTTPHTIILLLAGGSTFISGGISGYKILFAAGFMLFLAAFISGFVIPSELVSLVFASGMLVGYLVPGIILNKRENDEA
ncbi:MAG: hypothetical protein ACI857_001702 [Arenicella sp.]|jgi:hypothetical protein